MLPVSGSPWLSTSLWIFRSRSISLRGKRSAAAIVAGDSPRRCMRKACARRVRFSSCPGKKAASAVSVSCRRAANPAARVAAEGCRRVAALGERAANQGDLPLHGQEQRKAASQRECQKRILRDGTENPVKPHQSAPAISGSAPQPVSSRSRRLDISVMRTP